VLFERSASVGHLLVTLLQVALIFAAMSVAGLGGEHGSFLTSLATTAKPRPALPAGRLDFCIQGEQAGLLGDGGMT